MPADEVWAEADFPLVLQRVLEVDILLSRTPSATAGATPVTPTCRLIL